jgi:hypothetical protein
LNWSDWASRTAGAARLGWREYRAAVPLPILLTAVLPRAVLQCLFFGLLGQALAGTAGARFAFVGSLAAVMTLTTVVAVCDVPMADKQWGTFARLRSGVVSPALVLFARTAPYPLVGFGSAVVALAVGGPLLLPAGDLPAIARTLPLFAAMALTSTGTGLAVGALAVGRRADVLLGNIMAYLILLASGVLVPPERAAWMRWLGVALPLRHGLAAVRAELAGRPWHAQLLAEVAVGAGWSAAACGLIAVQARRARRHGFDDFE